MSQLDWTSKFGGEGIADNIGPCGPICRISCCVKSIGTFGPRNIGPLKGCSACAGTPFASSCSLLSLSSGRDSRRPGD
eukprot:1449857-Rhodomonas_salina.1